MNSTANSAIKLVPDLGAPSDYKDRSFQGTAQEYAEAISKSCTLYIGNLSFYTTEEQLYEFFGKFGLVKRVIIGLDRNAKTPCGFCFIEYFRREDALFCKRNCDGWKLDDRVIRVDWDYGFQEGRQFGRGKSGGQVRDEYRKEYDSGRGGYSKSIVFSEPRDAEMNFNSQYGNSSNAPKRNPRFRESSDEEAGDE